MSDVTEIVETIVNSTASTVAGAVLGDGENIFKVNNTGSHSVYRPFGNLPEKAFSADESFAVEMVASSIGGLAFVLAIIILIFTVRKNRDLAHDMIKQRTNMYLMLAGALFILVGCASVIDAVREYPKQQTIFGQMCSFAAFWGFNAALLTSMYYSPIVFEQRGDNFEKHEKHLRQWTGATLAIGSVIGIALEVATISVNVDYNYGLNVTLFTWKILSLVTSISIGIYTVHKTVIVEAETTQELKKIDENDSTETPRMITSGNVVVDKLGFNWKWKTVHVSVMTSLILIYTVISSIESPSPLVMRGMEMLVLLFIWIMLSIVVGSVFMTLYHIEKNKWVSERVGITKEESEKIKRRQQNPANRTMTYVSEVGPNGVHQLVNLDGETASSYVTTSPRPTANAQKYRF